MKETRKKSGRGVIYGANPTVCWRDWG